MKETKLKTKKVYEYRFLSVDEDEVLLSNGKQTKRIILRHPGGAAVLPITTDGEILLIKQYRYPIHQALYEVPAGKLDDDDPSSLTCAMRELEEETGYVSNEVKKIYTIHPCVGYSDEKLDLFIAFNCTKKENPKSMDSDEAIEVNTFSTDAIKSMLESGLITDGKTLIALQYYFMYITSTDDK